MKKWVCDICKGHAHEGISGYAYAGIFCGENISVEVTFFGEHHHMDVCEDCQNKILLELASEKS